MSVYRWLAPCMPADRFNGQTFCLAMCCRCIYIAQLHERVVKRQSFPKVLGILVGVQVVGWILKFYGEHIFIEVHTGNRMIDALDELGLPILVTELAVGLVYLKYVIELYSPNGFMWLAGGSVLIGFACFRFFERRLDYLQNLKMQSWRVPHPKK